MPYDNFQMMSGTSQHAAPITGLEAPTPAPSPAVTMGQQHLFQAPAQPPMMNVGQLYPMSAGQFAPIMNQGRPGCAGVAYGIMAPELKNQDIGTKPAPNAWGSFMQYRADESSFPEEPYAHDNFDMLPGEKPMHQEMPQLSPGPDMGEHPPLGDPEIWDQEQDNELSSDSSDSSLQYGEDGMAKPTLHFVASLPVAHFSGIKRRVPLEDKRALDRLRKNYKKRERRAVVAYRQKRGKKTAPREERPHQPPQVPTPTAPQLESMNQSLKEMLREKEKQLAMVSQRLQCYQRLRQRGALTKQAQEVQPGVKQE